MQLLTSIVCRTKREGGEGGREGVGGDRGEWEEERGREEGGVERERERRRKRQGERGG